MAQVQIQSMRYRAGDAILMNQGEIAALYFILIFELFYYNYTVQRHELLEWPYRKK